MWKLLNLNNNFIHVFVFETITYKQQFNGSAEFLWRFARSHISVFDSRDKEEQHQLAATAVKACEQALELNSKNFNVYKWFVSIRKNNSKVIINISI